jgi:hypothetical protein
MAALSLVTLPIEKKYENGCPAVISYYEKAFISI